VSVKPRKYRLVRLVFGDGTIAWQGQVLNAAGKKSGEWHDISQPTLRKKDAADRLTAYYNNCVVDEQYFDVDPREPESSVHEITGQTEATAED
jgi:hypothetical protein